MSDWDRLLAWLDRWYSLHPAVLILGFVGVLAAIILLAFRPY